MPVQLFRQEAIDAQREKLLGAVSTARPVPMRVFTVMAAAFAAALIVYAFWGEYTRRERVDGILASTEGSARVFAGVQGNVDKVFLKEGAEVTKGDLIATLALSKVGRIPQAEIEAQIKGVDNEMTAAKLVARQEEEAARARIASSTAELQASDSEIELQAARVESAKRELERGEQLAKNGFYSEAETIKRRNELLEQQGKLAVARRQRAVLERDLASARSDLASVQLKLMEKNAQLERRKSELVSSSKTEAGLRSTDVVAPTSGVATNIVSPGDSVVAESQIATIVPKGNLRAQLLVPTRASGFIRAGNPVVLRYEAFPFQRFGQYRGEVDDVSRTVLSVGEKLGGALVAREPVYRVDVKLDRQTVAAAGQELPLRSGMLLSADILLEKRTVFQWVFEPVIEWRERLQ